MEAFLVLLGRDGPEWEPALGLEEQARFRDHARFMDALVTDGFLLLGGPLADERRVAYVVEAASEEAVRARLAADPWSGTHLVVRSVDRWTLRLDFRDEG
jgi:uncharacterized protein YciI